MYARNVSIHLKPNMLSDYTGHLRMMSFRYCVNRTVLRTKLHSPVPTERMSLQSVCGTTRPMQRLTITISTQTW